MNMYQMREGFNYEEFAIGRNANRFVLCKRIAAIIPTQKSELVLNLNKGSAYVTVSASIGTIICRVRCFGFFFSRLSDFILITANRLIEKHTGWAYS